MFDDTIQIMPKAVAVLFWVLYIALLPLCVMAIVSSNGFTGHALGFGIVLWALCLPGYVILFSMAYERLRSKK